MLAEGGSAVDAAIAVSLAIGVERSLSSGIGGGGFMTYYSRWAFPLPRIALCTFLHSC